MVRRNVRRGRAVLVIRFIVTSFERRRAETSRRRPPHGERCALRNAEDDGREFVIPLLRFADNFSHRGRIVVLDASTECEGQQFFGERGGEKLRALEQTVFERRDARELAAVRQAAGSIDGFALLQLSPAADRIVALEREARWIDQVVTTRAGGVRTVLRE